uniref:Uncharacterized protein n=1 Tax=Sphaerodactylus townsendi TaxID=933632 RepID=A0ACB8FUP8_9SAUR
MEFMVWLHSNTHTGRYEEDEIVGEQDHHSFWPTCTAATARLLVCFSLERNEGGRSFAVGRRSLRTASRGAFWKATRRAASFPLPPLRLTPPRGTGPPTASSSALPGRSKWRDRLPVRQAHRSGRQASLLHPRESLRGSRLHPAELTPTEKQSRSQWCFWGVMPSSVSQHVSRVRSLYRIILRLHRALPLELKTLGDQYVKDEFRRHKSVGSAEAQCFLQEWEISCD